MWTLVCSCANTHSHILGLWFIVRLFVLFTVCDAHAVIILSNRCLSVCTTLLEWIVYARIIRYTERCTIAATKWLRIVTVLDSIFCYFCGAAVKCLKQIHLNVCVSDGIFNALVSDTQFSFIFNPIVPIMPNGEREIFRISLCIWFDLTWLVFFRRLMSISVSYTPIRLNQSVNFQLKKIEANP